MKTNNFILVIATLLLITTSCRSRLPQVYVVHHAQETQQLIRTTATTSPSVYVSYRHGNEQVSTQLPQSAIVQPTAQVPTRTFHEGSSNVIVTFTEAPPSTRPTPAQQPAIQPIRQEGVSAVTPIDASGLRRFSVVVASLQNRLNAETLQMRLQNAGHHVILVQNERGMFRVIVGSFDDSRSALNQRNALQNQYSGTGIQRFGIPFNDLWVLDRHF